MHRFLCSPPGLRCVLELQVQNSSQKSQGALEHFRVAGLNCEVLLSVKYTPDFKHFGQKKIPLDCKLSLLIVLECSGSVGLNKMYSEH